MCGRFAQWSPPEVVAREFSVEVPGITPRYNVAPTQAAGVVRVSAGGAREYATLRWGLVPAWAKDPAVGNRNCNARAETVGEKPSFREAFRRRRCLVPADGYYEWRKEGARKQPYYFRRRDGRPLALAGLWERWEGGGGKGVETFSVITTAANEVARAVHDRMPVIVSPEDYELWLGTTSGRASLLEKILRPAAADVLETYAVTPRVNSPANDDEGCVEPI